MQVTNVSLLERMKDLEAHDAWEEFCQTYWAVILRYAQKLGLDETAAQDVLQETMVALMRALPQFSYNSQRGKFRNFLLTIVHRKVLAAKRRLAARPHVSLDHATHEGGLVLAEKLADEQSLLPSKLVEGQWRESVREEALRRVREDPNIQGRTWEIFSAYVIDQLSAVEVAQNFGIAENAVYQIKNRMLRRLREEVKRLTDETDAAT